MSDFFYEAEPEVGISETRPQVDAGETVMHVKIDGWPAKDLHDRIASMVAEKLLQHARSEIDGAIAKVVKSLVDETMRDRVAQQIDVILAEGWRKTNDYGYASGEKITVRARIEELLRPQQNGYSGHNLQKFVDDSITRNFSKELEAGRKRAAEHIDALVSKAMDETVLSRIKNALAESFGVKTR